MTEAFYTLVFVILLFSLWLVAWSGSMRTSEYTAPDAPSASLAHTDAGDVPLAGLPAAPSAGPAPAG